MERETKTIETPGGHKVVLKTYLTQRETNSITKKESLKDISSINTANLPIGLAMEFTTEVMRAVVVSMDDKTEKVIENILDLPSAEAFVIQQASIEIFKAGFPTAK